MIGNYIKLAFRHLARNKFYALINILGLSVGFVCTIFILLYIDNELSYDKHHEKHERIFRMEFSQDLFSGIARCAKTGPFLGPTMKEECPGVIEAVRFVKVAREFFRYGEKTIWMDDIYLADASVFDVFTHRFLRGTPENVLKQHHAVVLTESLAKKCFGTEDPIGKKLRTRNEGYRIVTAVIEDLPDNSHLKFEALIFLGSSAFGEFPTSLVLDRNLAPVLFTYVLVNERTTISNVIDSIERFLEEYFVKDSEQGESFELMATPLADVHYGSSFGDDLPTGNMSYLYVFGTVAVFLLVIASINYINMATACAGKREKEVGLRKAMGASGDKIIRQFLVESLIISLVAMILSILLAEVFLPFFNQFLGKDLVFPSSENVGLIGLILLISLIVGLASGSYPAFYLSRFMPNKILQQTLKTGGRSGFFRKVLVVIQFSISIIMIIVTLLVFRQFTYMKTKDLGFDKKDVMVVRPIGGESFRASIGAFKEELLRSPLIQRMATSYPVLGAKSLPAFFGVEREGQMKEVRSPQFFVDYDYLGLLGIKIKEGRGFDPNMGADEEQAFVINESAAKHFEWGENALGKKIQFLYEMQNRNGKVIGVVKDFNFLSLHEAVAPLVISLDTVPLEYDVTWLYIKVQPGKDAEAVRFVEQTLKRFGVDDPMDHYFLEDKLEKAYRNEEKLGTTFGFFSIICILISCLGLLGLSSFVTEQRTKEIGIRKVLGAKISNIIYLLSKEFLILVLIANIVAWPIAAYLMSKWLESFAFRIEINLSTFVLAALAAFLIAFLTVAFQAFKAASANPIKALRYE
jgi:putative ABC transport system permease protein